MRVPNDPPARALECDLLTLQKDETVQALSVLAQPCAGVPEVLDTLRGMGVPFRIATTSGGAVQVYKEGPVLRMPGFGYIPMKCIQLLLSVSTCATTQRQAPRAGLRAVLRLPGVFPAVQDSQRRERLRPPTLQARPLGLPPRR
jgi:hypothetical protein